MSDGQWIERATLDLWEDRHREQLAFIKELATKLATCEKYRDAYAEMDRIGTQAVRDLEAKLAKAVEGLEWYDDPSSQGDVARATLAEIKGENKDGK